MILLDIFNIKWTWSEFWNGYALGAVIMILFAWLAGVALLWLTRAVAKWTKIYDEERDDIVFKFSFWVVTIFLWGLAFGMTLDGVLLHTSSSSGIEWFVIIFGFIAYNVIKILSRH